MSISRKTLQDALQAATEDGTLSAAQRQELLAHIARAQAASGAALTFTAVLYYLGGFIAIGAVTFLMDLGWEVFGGGGVLGLSLLYGALALALAGVFQAKGARLAAQTCAVFIVALAPLAVYGALSALGLWQVQEAPPGWPIYDKWNNLYAAGGGALAGAAVFWRFRYPLVLLPLAVALWFFALMLAEIFIGGGRGEDGPGREVTFAVGALLLLAALTADKLTRAAACRSASSPAADKAAVNSRAPADYAFWLYITGALLFWGALNDRQPQTAWGHFFYLCVNAAMLAAGIFIRRGVFALCGGLGVFIYLRYLSDTFFAHSVLFPLVLTAAGLGLVCLGFLWQKNEKMLREKIRRLLQMQNPPPQ